jgi:hypothetical protein
MTWRKYIATPLYLVLFVCLQCASGWTATSSSTAPVSIRVVPQNVKIGGGEDLSQHFLVLAQYPDGIERDVTPRAAFSLSDSAKGAIDTTGKFVPRGRGQVTLIARFGGRTGKASIEMEAAGQKLPFSFGRDIGGIFTRRGCNSTSCHGIPPGTEIPGHVTLIFSVCRWYGRISTLWTAKT